MNQIFTAEEIVLMERFVFAALLGILLSAVFAICLHMLNPDFNPVTRAMSDYVHGKYGALMTATLIMFGLSLLALAGAFRYVASSTQQQFGVVFLAAAGVCMLSTGIFPIDNTADGSFKTVPGAIHAVAGHLLSPLIVAAMLLLSGVWNQSGDNQALQMPLITLAIINTVAYALLLTVNLVIRWPVGGFGQRIFMALICCWLLLASARLLIVARTAPF